MISDVHDGWKHEEAVIHGIRLHWVEAGEGPLVVLLHGFPEPRLCSHIMLNRRCRKVKWMNIGVSSR